MYNNGGFNVFQVLNIENNRIATLPSELGLVNLQTLNARGKSAICEGVFCT